MSIRARTTASIPLDKSPAKTRAEATGPKVRRVLAAPVRPLPYRLTSIPRALPSTRLKGIEP